MSLFSDFEKSIERGFRHWTDRMFGPAQSDDLILLHRAILEEIETGIEVVARGRKIFPHSSLVVTLVSPDAGRRELLQAAFAGEDRLRTTSARRSKRPAARFRAASRLQSGPPKPARARSRSKSGSPPASPAWLPLLAGAGL